MMMVRKRKGLTERHRKILEFLREYQAENKYPPSIREIGEKTGISSTSVVNYYLEQLEREGLIERDRGISRGVRLVTTAQPEMFRVPILGRIVAGEPITIPETDFSLFDAEASVEIATSLLPPREKAQDLFALEVEGDSMIDAMVNNGDIVIMKPVKEVHNGEMVAVWLPEKSETTLKYFYKEKDGYRLQPANPTMKPILIKKDEPLEIRGKVVMVIRKVHSIAA
jgi:repressor LexA